MVTIFASIANVVKTGVDALDEAEDTLRQSLELREAFYGQQHAGYAFGLEPLAVLKMRAEQWQEARELIEQTIDIFWADGHPRIASAFPYRAWILKQLNDPQPAFDGLEDVPDEIIADMIQQLGQLLNQQQAACSQAVIDDLIKALEQRYPAEHNFLLQLQGFQAMVQRWIGPSEGRVESLEKLSQALLDQQRLPEAVDALIGLAEAFDALHDRQSAETTFHRALHYAHQSEDPRLVSTASRNFGLFYDQSLGSEEAEIYLRQAVEAAEATDDIQLLGTGLIALGIYLQHKAQTEEAEQHLERGLRLLPPADFNYICGSSHLQAIQSGGSCGCGDTTEAYLAALRNHILETVPEGLINDAKVSQGDDGQIQVELDFDHELDEQESEQVRRAMQQAHLDFQRKMKGES